jgi:replicative DNA helicase
LGRHVRTTLSHPFLTPEGWLPLGSLGTGSLVAIPKRLPVFGIDSMPDNELGLMAYLLSERAQNGDVPCVRSRNVDAIEEAARHALSMGGRAIRHEHDDESMSALFIGQSGRTNPVVELLRRHGLLTCSADNRDVPQSIFRLPKPNMAYFLRRLLATDGAVVANLDAASGIEWATSSRRLAQSVQHLLLRFGVNAALAFDTEHTRLSITEAADVRRFEHEIGMLGHEADLKALLQSLRSEPKVLVAAGAEPVTIGGSGVFAPTLWQDPLASLSSGGMSSAGVTAGDTSLPTDADIRWDEIVSIDYDGDEQVYDLTVPYHHNFVAGDVIVHNTAFALNMAANAAMAGTPTLYFSLEMSHLEITQRLLCSEARVDASRLRNGKLHDSDWPKINHAIGRLGEAPIFIDDNPNLTVMDIRAKARRLKATPGGLGLVIVDYLQLMSGRASAESRQVEVSEMSRGLKILARELNCPVIALSQLSRSLEMRADKRPMLADLRESGSLEQDADVVMFLYRDEVYNPESADKGMAEVILSKHRNGPVGTTQLAFTDRYTRFANMARV